jgi:hypothetical protein
MSILAPVLAALLVVLVLRRLRRGRRGRKLAMTPLGGIQTDFFSPYAMPGRGRRSGKGF